jgi:hypothetical protein
MLQPGSSALGDGTPDASPAFGVHPGFTSFDEVLQSGALEPNGCPDSDNWQITTRNEFIKRPESDIQQHCGLPPIN